MRKRTMTMDKLMRNVARLGLLCLVAFAFFSCTRDYLVDETNIRLHVPQIENKEIDNFFVSFHDKNGKHVYTRKISTPFNEAPDGIMKFKIYPGKDYTLSCFANFTPGSITEGKSFVESSKLFSKANDESKNRYGDNIFNSIGGDARFLGITNVEIMPLMPIPPIVEVDIDTDTRMMGSVQVTYVDLPTFITRIDILYKGLGTRFKFEDEFNKNTPADRVLASANVADFVTSGVEKTMPVSVVFPSVGTRCNDVPIVTPEQLELEGYFYNGDEMVGSMSFTASDFMAMVSKPVDENNTPVTDLVLKSRKMIKLKISGFTVIGIELGDWDGVDEGTVTPM